MLRINGTTRKTPAPLGAGSLHPEIQDDVAELKKAFEEYAEAGLKHFSEVVHSEVDLLDLMMPETSKKSREEQLTANLRRSIDELLEE
ncbi:MAG: hypothetical protein QGH39_03700 [Candidatus Thermoplasmatota archaeon]|nr:hypothetical protein [Candidatus Thermoplasmatota archaeon]